MRNMLFISLFFSLNFASTSFGSDSVRSFERRFEIEVPARGLLQDPPSREKTFLFELPTAYTVVREANQHGATVTHVNFGGLDEKQRRFTSTDRGVKLEWELENEESFPVNGRKAYIVLQLKGKRTSPMNLSSKYESLRNRFFENFYFSGRVAEWINANGTKVKFADQTIYMGQALMVLSSEMAIRRDAGLNTADAHEKIQQILDAFDELDRKAIARYGSDEGNTLNGLFVRDDITGPDDPRLENRFDEVASDWQNPENENASPSGDQIFGMMYGLYCVVHYSGDEGLASHAKQISLRLYDYARRTHFILRLPNGEATRRGSDVRWLSSLMHGLNKSITGEDFWDDSRIEVGPLNLPLNGIGALWDSNSTPDTISQFIGLEFQIPVIDEEIELNSFALHILLMALAPSNVWSQNELEKVAVKANHVLAALWYAKAHGVLPQQLDENFIKEILAACPETGPRANLSYETGWQYDNRWIRCTKIDEPNEGNEQFNGLDWLLLNNFHQLVFHGP